MPRVYIETYGRTLNNADSDIMKALISEGPHEIVRSEGESGVVILNTIMGTASLRWISRAVDDSPDGRPGDFITVRVSGADHSSLFAEIDDNSGGA